MVSTLSLHHKMEAVLPYLHLFYSLQFLLHLQSKRALQPLHLTTVLLRHGILGGLVRLSQLLWGEEGEES